MSPIIIIIGAGLIAILALLVRIVSERRLNLRLEREREEAIDKVIIESRKQHNETMDRVDKKFDELDEAINEYVEREGT